MVKGICEICGKETNRINRHHEIPWEKDSKIWLLCPVCHCKFHMFFNNFIVSQLKGKENNKIRVKEYMKEFVRGKTILLMTDPYIYFKLSYNVRTTTVSCSYLYYYNYKYKYLHGESF